MTRERKKEEQPVRRSPAGKTAERSRVQCQRLHGVRHELKTGTSRETASGSGADMVASGPEAEPATVKSGAATSAPVGAGRGGRGHHQPASPKRTHPKQTGKTDARPLAKIRQDDGPPRLIDLAIRLIDRRENRVLAPRRTENGQAKRESSSSFQSVPEFQPITRRTEANPLQTEDKTRLRHQ